MASKKKSGASGAGRRQKGETPRRAKKRVLAQITSRRITSEDLTRKAVELGRARAERIIERQKRARQPKIVTLASAGFLMMNGDSWFSYGAHDIIDQLKLKFGYEIEGDARTGRRIIQLAHDRDTLEEFCDLIGTYVRAGKNLKALLLSGGGNDIADTFKSCLFERNSPQPGWNQQMVDAYLNLPLKEAYSTIASTLDQYCTQLLNRPVPIFVHGYAHPVPDGRGIIGRHWLREKFEAMGYYDQGERTALAKILLDQFNTMLSNLARDSGIASVRYVNLRPGLSSGPDYQDFWTNELHPKRQGFESVGRIMAAALSAI